jgi:DNA-binding NarL/FixJ family response regulator
MLPAGTFPATRLFVAIEVSTGCEVSSSQTKITNFLTTMNSPSILIFDNSLVREALLRVLPEGYEAIPFPDDNFTNDSPEQCVKGILSLAPRLIVVNVDYRFTIYPRLSAGGLRLVELLRMEMDFPVRILVYSWRSLQELRTDPVIGFGRLIDLLELADETGNTVTRFLRLPASSAQLVAVITQLSQVDPDQRDRFKEMQVVRSLLEDEMERLCRSIRHRYQNVLAAQRLLLGAYLAGDISFTSLSESAGKIGNKDNELLAQITVLREKWLKVEQKLTIARGKTTQQQAPSDPFTGKILVVDDHYEADPDSTPVAGSIGDFGWSHVYKALFETRHFQFDIIGASSYDEALKHINFDSLAELKLIILDVDLGAPEQSGLHLLQLIRSRDPFIPVLVMTSFDDAEVCQTALELQADGFFAKQLWNEADRTSLDYYNSLVNTVKRILQDLNEDRELYQTFAHLTPSILRNDVAKANGNPQRIGDGALSELTKFFLLLRASKRHHLARHLLINNGLQTQDDGGDELMLVLLDAILAWANCRTGPHEPQIESFDAWLRRSDLHYVVIASFCLDHEANIIEADWKAKSEGFFGYETHEIKGMNFQALLENGSPCPFHDEMEQSCLKQQVYFRKKGLPSERVIIDIKPLEGKFKVEILRYVHNLIDAARKWPNIRHSRKSKVSLNDVRKLAKLFLETISATTTSPADRPHAQRETVFRDSVPNVINRARQREGSIIREHVIKSKMGSTAVLLGGYFASAPSTAPDPRIEAIIGGFWEMGVQPDWNGATVFSLLEEPSEDALLYLNLKNPRETPLSVLVIDDHAKTNGWAYVAQLVHHDAIVTNVEFTGAAENPGFESYVVNLLSDAVQNSDLVLLDLRMPAFEGDEAAVETGLRVAEIIKRLDPLLPVIFLSAQNDAITMRNGIAYGATDFFPKEAPYTRNVTDMVEYFNQFSYVPQKLRLDDEEWIKFAALCRRALFNLDKLADHLSSLPTFTALPKFLTTVLNEKISQSNLSLLLDTTKPIQKVHAAVVNRIAALFRRALFFVFLPRERYLSPWVSYFADAVPGMNAAMLGYDQVWIDCGMIVEYTFNVVALGCCRASRLATPRERTDEQNNSLIHVLRRTQHETGMKIWDGRNERRYGQYNARANSEAKARELVTDCINFLSGVGLIDLTPPAKASPTDLHSLRENLQKSLRRRKVALEVADKEKNVRSRTSHSVFLQSEMDNLLSLNAAKKELERLNVKTVLDERHLLLEHLLM